MDRHEKTARTLAAQCGIETVRLWVIHGAQLKLGVVSGPIPVGFMQRVPYYAKILEEWEAEHGHE